MSRITQMAGRFRGGRGTGNRGLGSGTKTPRGTGGTTGGSAKDQAIGRGVRSLLRKAR